ncbi:MAG: NIPSNAP family protein [Bryobacteraceae bacterium]
MDRVVQTPGAPRAPRFFVLEQYFLRNGSQPGRVLAFLEKGALAARRRLGLPAPAVVMEALVAAHMPQVACITPYDSLEQWAQTRARLASDENYRAALSAMESGEEAPYEEYSETLLEAAPYTPPLPASLPALQQPRVFELRLYHSPTERQLKALHERFAGPEIPIFHRSGIHPLLYGSTLAGAHKPNLVYLTPFDSLAAREKAWAAFGADPEWVKVRAESIARHGQISSVIQISIYRAAAWSPLR